VSINAYSKRPVRSKSEQNSSRSTKYPRQSQSKFGLPWVITSPLTEVSNARPQQQRPLLWPLIKGTCPATHLTRRSIAPTTRDQERAIADYLKLDYGLAGPPV
jgi:hypothetical protein